MANRRRLQLYRSLLDGRPVASLRVRSPQCDGVLRGHVLSRKTLIPLRFSCFRIRRAPHFASIEAETPRFAPRTDEVRLENRRVPANRDESAVPPQSAEQHGVPAQRTCIARAVRMLAREHSTAGRQLVPQKKKAHHLGTGWAAYRTILCAGTIRASVSP